MPGKALVAFGFLLGSGLLALSAPAWCSELNATQQLSSNPLDTKPNMAEVQPSNTAASLSPLTLQETLTRTLKTSPRLSAFSQELRAREFEAEQAGLRPNPELSIEVENLAGSGESTGFDNVETSLRISQRLELGGKRSTRQKVGLLEMELARQEYEITRAEVLAETTELFIEALAAPMKFSLAKEQVALARKVLQAVEDRIAAGKTAQIEGLRFATLVSEARLRKKTAQQQLLVSHLALAASWGSEDIDFEAVQGQLDQLSSVPPLTELTARLDQSLQAALQQSNIRRADGILALELANRTPDLTLSLGARNSRETGDNSLLAEVSVPLQFFDRNQNAVAAARARLTGAREQQRTASLKQRTELARLWQEMNSAQIEVDMLRQEIVPAAQKTFDASAYGYEAGKFGFMEVLDAQRTLFEVKIRSVDALVWYHNAAARLERLLGRKLYQAEDINSPSDNQRGQ